MIRHFSAGGVVYKKDGSEVLFLIKLNSGEPKVWCLPKGWLDDAALGVPGPRTLGKIRATTQEVRDTALREVREETGVEAKIISRLGENKFIFLNEQKEKVFKTVIYFLMQYVADLPAGFDYETSAIKWVTLDRARELLKQRRGEFALIETAAGQIL